MKLTFREACALVDLPLDIQEKLYNRYNEIHRFYHNIEHIDSIFNYVKHYKDKFSHEEFKALTLAILYHDAIMVIGSKTNEHDSSVLMVMELPDFSDALLSEADRLIMLTSPQGQHTTEHDDALGLLFLKADLLDFYGEASQIIVNHKKIFKEYQKYDWTQYRTGRISALENLANDSILSMSKTAQTNIEYEIERLKVEEINIGLYAGSFNPFHVGHLDILKKAEKVFDKVIIGFAQNPDKDDHTIHVPLSLKHYQCESIEGLLTEFVNERDYHISIIKGLRNNTDMNQSVKDYKWMLELSKKPIDIVSFFCDPKLEHVSSSDLRNIVKLSGKENSLYQSLIVK